VAHEHGFDSIDVDLIETPICEYRFRNDRSNTTDIFMLDRNAQLEWSKSRERVNEKKRDMLFTASGTQLEEMVLDKEEWRLKFLRNNGLVRALIGQLHTFTHPSGKIPLIIRMIHEDDKDIQARFDLNNKDDVLKLCVWWLRWGCLNYDLPFNTGISAEQFEEILRVESDGRFEALGTSFRMPQLFLTIYSGREDLQEKYDIKETEGLIGFMSWMINQGLEEYNLYWFFNCNLNFHRFLHKRCPYFNMNNLTYLIHYNLLRDSESLDEESAEKIHDVSIEDLRTQKYENEIRLIANTSK
jgi:hypothetical protein